MWFSDNAGLEDDGNASVPAGEGSWPRSKKTWEYRCHRCDVPMIISD
ncbi:hypothetical protein [Phocaeicola sp.]|nr:hypothetical protein [Phocaeicola sp.]MDE5677817.1 hypothetical protein [Phocaeicola sp.]